MILRDYTSIYTDVPYEPKYTQIDIPQHVFFFFFFRWTPSMRLIPLTGPLIVKDDLAVRKTRKKIESCHRTRGGHAVTMLRCHLGRGQIH